ncbi:MAG: formylglycine-generating enzyme family protein [Desulfatibacillum sp.]|nr:formylglycine-generating enzyme family protein [Desulfatibacillum sp.]
MKRTWHNMGLLAVLICLLAGGWLSLALAEEGMRSWVDEKGIRHYSDFFTIPQTPEPEPEPLDSGIPGFSDSLQSPDTQVQSRITNSLGMEFVFIKKGEFLRGSPKGEKGRDKEEKQHTVILIRDYYMQTTEVTQGQWKAVMEGQNPSWFSGCDSCPVEYVSHEDAEIFIRTLNELENVDWYRLPTEAEWEHACRAGSTTRFAYGDCLGDNADYDGNFPSPGCPKGQYPERTAPVAKYPPNAWGLYDMHGNVWEWCSDWYAPYPEEFSLKNPAGPAEGAEKVCRGGGWLNDEKICRSAYRSKRPPSTRSNSVGFRLCLYKNTDAP